MSSLKNYFLLLLFISSQFTYNFFFNDHRLIKHTGRRAIIESSRSIFILICFSYDAPFQLFDDSSKSPKKDNPASPFERVRTFSIYEKPFQYTRFKIIGSARIHSMRRQLWSLWEEKTEIRCVVCARVCSYRSRVTHYRPDACSTFRSCYSKFVSTWRQSYERRWENNLYIFAWSNDELDWRIFNESTVRIRK